MLTMWIEIKASTGTGEEADTEADTETGAGTGAGTRARAGGERLR